MVGVTLPCDLERKYKVFGLYCRLERVNDRLDRAILAYLRIVLWAGGRVHNRDDWEQASKV